MRVPEDRDFLDRDLEAAVLTATFCCRLFSKDYVEASLSRKHHERLHRQDGSERERADKFSQGLPAVVRTVAVRCVPPGSRRHFPVHALTQMLTSKS